MSRQVNLDWLKTTFEEIKSGQKKYDDCLLAVYGHTHTLGFPQASPAISPHK